MDGDNIARVVIADDNSSVRAGVRRLLEKSANILIVGEAKNGREAVDLVVKLSPDVLILDIEMPVMGGIEALEELQRLNCPVHVLILTGNYDPFYVHEIFLRGAKGYILKEEAPGYLTSAVHLAFQGMNQRLTSPSIKNAGFDLPEAE